MGREAASDAIVRPSERTLRARASLPVPSIIDTPSATANDERRRGWPADQTERRNRWVYKHLVGTMDIKSLISATGLSPSSVERAIGDLFLAGHVRQDGRMYRRSETTPYTDDELANAEFPGRARRIAANAPRGARAHRSSDPLSKLIANASSIPSDSLDSYREMYEAVSRLPHVGIRELDDVSKAFADAIRARMDNVRHDCPVCGRRLEVTYTKVHCSRCPYTIDVGDVSRALKLAEALKEGSE